MVDPKLLSFSFVQGVLAFFAPCAVSLLPGYLSYFITKNQKEKKFTSLGLARRAFYFSILTVAGILLVYGVATVLILIAREFVKSAFVYVAMGLGVVVIILGIFMALNKPLSFSFHGPKIKTDNQSKEAFIFGISYAIGILGCLFPFFLTVASFAIGAPSVIIGSSYLIVYMLGMSILMVAFYFLAIFAQKFLQGFLGKFMPYLNRIGGVFVIIAGIYIIYYQSALL